MVPCSSMPSPDVEKVPPWQRPPRLSADLAGELGPRSVDGHEAIGCDDDLFVGSDDGQRRRGETVRPRLDEVVQTQDGRLSSDHVRRR